MTVLQQLQVKQSEIREAINALLGLDARTEEQAAELLTFTAAAQELEPSIRAAIVATPDQQKWIGEWRGSPVLIFMDADKARSGCSL